MLLVCLRVDASGIRPVLLHERDELACADGVEWRFVASVEDPDEGGRLLTQLHYELPLSRSFRADHDTLRASRLGAQSTQTAGPRMPAC